jgi:hypothetical protein
MSTALCCVFAAVLLWFSDVSASDQAVEHLEAALVAAKHEAKEAKVKLANYKDRMGDVVFDLKEGLSQRKQCSNEANSGSIINQVSAAIDVHQTAIPLSPSALKVMVDSNCKYLRPTNMEEWLKAGVKFDEQSYVAPESWAQLEGQDFVTSKQAYPAGSIQKKGVEGKIKLGGSTNNALPRPEAVIDQARKDFRDLRSLVKTCGLIMEIAASDTNRDFSASQLKIESPSESMFCRSNDDMKVKISTASSHAPQVFEMYTNTAGNNTFTCSSSKCVVRFEDTRPLTGIHVRLELWCSEAVENAPERGGLSSSLCPHEAGSGAVGLQDYLQVAPRYNFVPKYSKDGHEWGGGLEDCVKCKIGTQCLYKGFLKLKAKQSPEWYKISWDTATTKALPEGFAYFLRGRDSAIMDAMLNCPMSCPGLNFPATNAASRTVLLRASLQTRLGEFGWDESVRNAVRGHLEVPDTDTCPESIMEDSIVQQHFANWSTHRDGSFSQDPHVGYLPQSLSIPDDTRGWNISASKRQLYVEGEGRFEKRMLCYTRPLNLTHNKEEVCCVQKRFSAVSGITHHNSQTATARLKNF